MTEQEYKREIDFIFNQFPSYQKVGKIAYKPGIETMLQMDDILGNPHKKFRTIHVAGTNGKGSTSHMIASALMRLPAADDSTRTLRTGLYTSPHLVDFRERIKVNGEMVSKEFVYDFILKYKEVFLKYGASFFEITTAMAFAYFAVKEVDIAVIECGLGGILDSTNIITPQLCIITNIGLDHCEYLGYSYKEIAAEKAGIIKKRIPVVIGERGDLYPDKADANVVSVFIEKAALEQAPIYFAEDIAADDPLLKAVEREKMDLQGDCQDKNIKTVCTALRVWECLQDVVCGEMNPDAMARAMAAGIEYAAHDTGLRGRWETLRENPLVICDTGHNAHGFKLLRQQIDRLAERDGRLLMVFGVVADKDLDSIVQFLPNHCGGNQQAYYYFVNASGSRALPAELLAEKMKEKNFIGEAVIGKVEDGMNEGTVREGFKRALATASPNDFIFVGGSTFVVAEILG